MNRVYRQLYAVVVPSIFIVRVSFVFAEEEALDFVAMLERRSLSIWSTRDLRTDRRMDKAEAHELAENRIVIEGLEAIGEGRSFSFMDTFRIQLTEPDILPF